jgi:hypothetical protein
MTLPYELNKLLISQLHFEHRLHFNTEILLQEIRSMALGRELLAGIALNADLLPLFELI